MVEPKKNIKKLFRTSPTFISRIEKIVRLDKNERTTLFPKEHLDKILSSISPEEVVAYPELEPLYEKLSKWLGVNREEILISSGSDTGIRAVYEVYVDEGDEVVMLTPTYGMYEVYCKMFGAMKIDIQYNEDFSLPLERIAEKINDHTKLVVLANPNHTGTVIIEADLKEIIEKANRNSALVLIDEAYFHFYNNTIVPFISNYDNLIVVRTFSKAFGIAPLRVGFLVSNKSVIEQLYKVKLTHEITGISAKFTEYLLDNLDIMEEYVTDVISGKMYLREEFNNYGITLPETHANFVYAELPEGLDGRALVEQLKKESYYISGPFTRTPFRNHIRITVGPEAQMREFMTVFKEIYISLLKKLSTCKSEVG